MDDSGAARPMRVVERAIYRGPNIHSRGPLLRIRVDLGALEARPTDRLAEFSERLLDLLPGLGQHGCCFHEPGGFVRRLQAGTWLGHVAEHVALELQTVAGSPCGRGKTRSVRGAEGVYDVMYVFRSEAAGLLAGRRALELLDSLLPHDLRGVQGLDLVHCDPAPSADFNLASALDELRRTVRQTSLGPTTSAIAAAARRRGIPVARLDAHSLLQLGWGSRQQRVRASITGRTSHIAVENAGDKERTRALLTAAGVPVACGTLVRTADEAVRAAEGIGYPVVTKPRDGNHGRGVSVGLNTAEEVRWGFAQALAQGRNVIVEQMLPGRDHRILVIDGEVAAVAERIPAEVIGDGLSSVQALADAVNLDPRRGLGHEAVMTRLSFDAQVDEMLARQGLTRTDVPAADRRVQLRATANLSTGGTAVDRTDEIHPDNARLARRAALAVGLDVAGIDFLAPDIGRSVLETGGGVVEVNAAPGFRMHLAPSAGAPRDVAAPLVRMLFPRGTGRIPIAAVTGTNGKSTTCRMVAMVLREAGLHVGLTNTSGVYVDDALIHAADATGPKSALRVLGDPTVDAAVLETARGGILREGLAFDRCDVGALLNVEADHLGLKGIDTLEDLARVKGVVLANVRRDGVSVLNADDPQVMRLRRLARGRLALFSLRPPSGLAPHMREHLAAGGLGVTLDDADRIQLHEAGQATTVIAAADIPATMGGLARFNVANALAAVAICHGMGADLQVIARGLGRFASTYEQSPGRLNVFDGHGFRVIVDYAHNPAALTALAETVEGLRPHGGRLIAMLSIPGDRRDEDILAMGRIAGRVFDELVFRERPDGRGRQAGEIIALLSQGALQAGFAPDRLHRILAEPAATRKTLSLARPGDLVVLTPTGIESVWAEVLAFRPDFAGRSEAHPARSAAEPAHG